MRRLFLSIPLLAALPIVPSAADPAEEAFLREDIPAELRGRIAASIERGDGAVRAILTRMLDLADENNGQIPNKIENNQFVDPWMPYPQGEISICLLTLLKCGAPVDDPLVERSMAFLREYHFDQDKFRMTYSVAIHLMALQTYLHAPREREIPPREREEYLNWAARLAFWLASGCSDGHWTYQCPGFEYGTGRELPYAVGEGETEPSTRPPPRRGPFGRRPRRPRPSDVLEPEPESDGIRFERPPPVPEFKPVRDGARYDNSNTQYGILGLKAAVKLGIEMPDALWESVVEHFLESQQEEGNEVHLARELENGEASTLQEPRHARGWPYLAREGTRTSATHSMTTAGIAALKVAATEIEDNRLHERIRTAVEDGLAWMQANFQVTSGGHHRYYYLYGLERACVFTQVRRLGEHDWYVEGAEFLLREQKEDGNWGHNVNDTCWALLFLKRSSEGFIEPEYGVGSD